MNRPAIDVRDLSPELQARVHRMPGGAVVRLGPNSPLPDAKNAKRSSDRARSGKSFEKELDELTHPIYHRQGRACLRQHHPRVAGAPGAMVYAAGGAPCDFGGAAMIWGQLWPILFDAKGIGDSASYTHAEDQRHQLDELLAHRALGGVAFLILRDAGRGIAYLVTDPADFRALRAGDAIAVRTGRSKAMEHLYPIVRQDPASRVWDWLSVLESHPQLRPCL